MNRGSILVTGGQGFLGSAIVRKLAVQGHEVISVDLHSKNHNELANVKNFNIDITNFDAFHDLCQLTQPSAIIHTAATLSMAAEQNPYQSNLINVMGSSNVFRSALVSKVKRVVYASSVAVYGEARRYPDTKVSETDGKIVQNMYAAQKAMNECEGKVYRTAFGLETSAVRLSYIYGPGAGESDGSTNFIIHSLNTVANGKSPFIPCSSEMKVCLQYIEDIAQLFIWIATSKQETSLIYQPGGTLITMGEFSELIKKLYPEIKIRLSKRDLLNAMDLPPQLYDDDLVMSQFPVEYSDLAKGIAKHVEAVHLTEFKESI